MPIVIMLASAITIIALVKYGLVSGIDRLSAGLGWSLKARGKATGYATSVPEFVALVAAGLSGVWEAGLWNIASSNLINFTLAALALVVYRRGGALMGRRFLGEIGFACLGIAAPLVLMRSGLDTHVAAVPILFALFFVYLKVDKGDGEQPEGQDELGEHRPWLGLLIIGVSLALIMVAGKFLGDATRGVVETMGIPAIVAGWMLGFVTSLPEAVTFFTVFSTKRRHGCTDPFAQVQELLDNLAASNMSNSGLIYPLGLTIYLLAMG
jgi:Ca2+/Na+ antiporter